jgi:glutamate-1-semialdehyde 2,1-aminomutase
LAMSTELADGLADLQFTSAYRVPFQFSPYLRARLKAASVVTAATESRGGGTRTRHEP